ncbi:hypothetical protein NDU88_001151 [Pleurodeles waltl]|uniref:Uncharacterized protein n=1 Tax=Pleurodeles waltl TaxID=8319 RepID=A0AAV7U9B0_PLEWA|nr:hypothetical protein NDU88_001151 [Pleurodeles waltl]
MRAARLGLPPASLPRPGNGYRLAASLFVDGWRRRSLHAASAIPPKGASVVPERSAPHVPGVVAQGGALQDIVRRALDRALSQASVLAIHFSSSLEVRLLSLTTMHPKFGGCEWNSTK